MLDVIVDIYLYPLQDPGVSLIVRISAQDNLHAARGRPASGFFAGHAAVSIGRLVDCECYRVVRTYSIVLQDTCVASRMLEFASMRVVHPRT